MVKTQVIWEYSVAIIDAASDFSEFQNELKQKSIDLGEVGLSNLATREIETDEAAGVVRHHWTREWSNPVAAQEWVDFVLAKGAKSAVVVEE